MSELWVHGQTAFISSSFFFITQHIGSYRLSKKIATCLAPVSIQYIRQLQQRLVIFLIIFVIAFIVIAAQNHVTCAWYIKQILPLISTLCSSPESIDLECLSPLARKPFYLYKGQHFLLIVSSNWNTTSQDRPKC